MIEHLMIFALGFLSAGLLTLLFLPAIWRRALRLSHRRLERRLPVSLAEVSAERDRLRAEFAVERRRIEQVNEGLIEARAQDMAELSRRGAQIATLRSEVQTLGGLVHGLENSVTEAERRAAHAEGVWAALEKEVLDSADLASRRMEDSVALQRGLLAATDLAETRRVQIAGLETQVEALRAELDDLRRDLSQAQLKLAEKSSAADLYAKERDFARADLAAANLRRDGLQKDVEERDARLSEREQELREAHRAGARMGKEIADLTRALETAHAAEAALRAQSETALEALRDEARDNALRAQDLRAERDSLQGALAAARREAQNLRDRTRQEAGAPLDRERRDEELRRAISNVGAEVLRLTTALDRQNDDVALTAAERMQQLQKRAGRASSMA